MPNLAETAAFSHLSAKRQLLRQFRQGLFAPDRGKRHFRLESRAVVPARSSRHAIACFRHLSQTQAGIPLIRAVQIPRGSSIHHPRMLLAFLSRSRYDHTRGRRYGAIAGLSTISVHLSQVCRGHQYAIA